MGTLLTIAEYCPIKYGQAVYSARVLVNTQYGYETRAWEDEELCISGVDYRRANPNSSTVNDSLINNAFIIYPNPASTELNFKIQNSNGCTEKANTKIEILDMLGNIVIKKDYDGFVEYGAINITILANGSYFIKYSCDASEIYRQSFVVNK